MKSNLTWKWAHGNKRQKKKIRLILERVCGCNFCCPEDRREQIRKKDLLKDVD